MSCSGRSTLAGLALAALASSSAAAASPPQTGALRTFTIEKPAPAPDDPRDPSSVSAPLSHLPSSSDHLVSTVGLGYVQGADWGMTLQSAGGLAGLQLQLDSFVTSGQRGARLDRGAMVVSDPDRGWRADAGDLFSGLLGLSRGARLSWKSWGGRQPSVAFYAPFSVDGVRHRRVAYRDELIVRTQRVLDAEVASDRSHLLLGHWTQGPASFDASYRRVMGPHDVTDKALQLSLGLASHVTLTAGVIRSIEDARRTDWFMGGLRVRVGKAVEIGFEHSKTLTSGAESATSAVTGLGRAGNLQLFHRVQFGRAELMHDGFATRVAREQLQSVASYAAGARVNFTLQLATDWSASGRPQQWEELQTTVKVTRGTTVQSVTAVPDVANAQRLRLRVTQNLPRHYAVEAEYGRQSPFQDRPFDFDRPRFRLMLTKQLRVPTPASGGDLRGRVVDHAGNAVAGARVTLGPYSAESGPDGSYRFQYLPAGQYALALDAAFLPADFAWDGAERQLVVSRATRHRIDLLVAPLNAIHGRVYCDRNGNGRFDDGEGVEGGVVRLNERTTATDRDGVYHFYNVWPGAYEVALDVAHLPAAFASGASTARSLTLGDGGPVVGADFLVIEKTKPIIWREIK